MSAPPDDTALVEGLVQTWLEDLFDALGRLFVSGVQYPDPELTEAFAVLGERGASLGADSASTRCGALARLCREMRPGPTDLPGRTALAASIYGEAQELLVWARLFRADVALQTAVVVARGYEAPTEREDLPLYTGRMHVLGLTLNDRQLGIHGVDDRGVPVFASDPLGDFDRHDLFGRPVISRLFQAEVWLGELGNAALDFDRHPFGTRGGRTLLKPAFRSVPKRVERSERPRSVSHVDFLMREDEVVARVAGGRLRVGRTLAFNATKRMAIQGSTSVRVPTVATESSGRSEMWAVLGSSGLLFPHIDARAWRISAVDLARWTESESLWVRAASAMFGGHLGPQREALFKDVVSAQVHGADAFRLAWWAARTGAEAPRVAADETPFGTWIALWHGEPARNAPPLTAPTLPDVCAQALRTDAGGDGEAAQDYLAAHVQHLRQTGRSAPVLPSSLELILLADTWAWLVASSRSGPVGDALELPVAPLRERVARSLYLWRTTGQPGTLGDDLALAALCSWGATVIAGGL